MDRQRTPAVAKAAGVVEISLAELGFPYRAKAQLHHRAIDLLDAVQDIRGVTRAINEQKCVEKEALHTDGNWSQGVVRNQFLAYRFSFFA